MLKTNDMNVILKRPDSLNTHNLLCKKDKGSFTKGQKSLCVIQQMSDGRLMVMTDVGRGDGYTVCRNEKEINEYFDEMIDA